MLPINIVLILYLFCLYFQSCSGKKKNNLPQKYFSMIFWEILKQMASRIQENHREMFPWYRNMLMLFCKELSVNIFISLGSISCCSHCHFQQLLSNLRNFVLANLSSFWHHACFDWCIFWCIH